MAKRKLIEIPPACSSVKEYEQSPWWRKKTKTLLENKEVRCPICNRERWVWQSRKKQWKRKIRFVTHHRTYKNVPHETSDDLMVMCWQCHDACHLILRSQYSSPMMKELAVIVKKYFEYDMGSAKENPYLNGTDKKLNEEKNGK